MGIDTSGKGEYDDWQFNHEPPLIVPETHDFLIQEVALIAPFSESDLRLNQGGTLEDGEQYPSDELPAQQGSEEALDSEPDNPTKRDEDAEVVESFEPPADLKTPEILDDKAGDEEVSEDQNPHPEVEDEDPTIPPIKRLIATMGVPTAGQQEVDPVSDSPTKCEPLDELLDEAKAPDEARRNAAAARFIRERPEILRKLILGPIASAAPETPLAHYVAYEQLNLIEQTNLAALSKDLITIYRVIGGPIDRLQRILAAAKDYGQLGWLNELGHELGKEFALELTSEVAADGIITALAIVFSVPTGPIGALVMAGKLLEAARTAP